jgi:hypothetical protein
VAKLDTAGALDAGWTLDLNRTVGTAQGRRMLLNNGNLYVGGDFDSATAGLVARKGLLKADAVTGTLDAVWDPDLSDSTATRPVVIGLTTDGINLYAAGSFDGANGGATSPSGVASFPLTGVATDNEWPVKLLPISTPGVNGICLLYMNGYVYLSGSFASVDALNGVFASNMMVRLDLAGNVDTDFYWAAPSAGDTFTGALGQLFVAGASGNWVNNNQNISVTKFVQISPDDDLVDLAFNASPGAESVVYGISLDGPIVYFVGVFDFIGLEIGAVSNFAAFFAGPDPSLSTPRAPQIDFLIRKEG